MREIITIQIGQAGNRIGQKFWKVISNEHGIDPNGQFNGESRLQVERLDVYYNESYSNRYVPRALLVDLDGATVQSIYRDSVGCLFDRDRAVFGTGGASNNFAKGFYAQESVSIADDVMGKVRRDAENCENLQGFQLLHASAGGAGSGLGSRLMLKLRDEYPRNVLAAFSVFPSPHASNVVVEPYNTFLATRHLYEHCDEVILLDNEAMFDICKKRLHLNAPSLSDLNHMISLVMSGCTAGFRFPGQLNFDLRKLAVNMVPYPQLVFVVPAFAPIVAQSDKKYRALTVPNLVQDIFASDNLMISIAETGCCWFFQ